MSNSHTPVVKDLVLAGGGHSHVTVLKRFGMKPIPGVRLTLVCRDVHTPYSGMLPGLIAGHYDFDDAHIDLGPLARFAGARLYHEEVTGLDLQEKKLICRGRPPVPYDILSLNIGSAPDLSQTPGATKHVVPVKPINNFIRRWELLSERLLTSGKKLRIGVIGAGAGGVELTLAVQHRLRRLLASATPPSDQPEFHLFSASAEILPTHSSGARTRFDRVLARRGVHVHRGAQIAEVREGSVRCASGDELHLDEILWVTQAGAAPWIKAAGLDVDERGFVKVKDTLQSTSHPEVFAAGDIAAVVNHPREKAGVFAVRQGRPLEGNLRRALLGSPLEPFHPQKNFLSLISTGDKYAVASRGNWSLSGRLVWRWKDWIDRRFMRKFSVLPEMRTDEKPDVPAGLASGETLKEISAAAMRCGGCGAKVGATVLSRALSRIGPIARDDILIGLNDPDDSAVVAVPQGKVMVHTVDYLRAIVDDPYVFGKVVANHALGDIFAMGGEPQSALAIATLPYGLEAKVEDTLTQLLTGATEVLNAAQTALVGGHTSEGAELSLGFAINGLADPQKVLRKGGMRPGDSLILTKPIGTGTLFAADMRLKAKGRWISGAVASMLQSNQEGAECLRRHGVTACTDVTGFGVLGHIVEMAQPSEVDVELYLNAIAVLEGAEETVAAGIFSSLQPQNLRLRRAIRDVDSASRHSRYPLIYDPQTAGGLLASVPADRAERCLEEMKGLGYERAAIVGRVVEKSEHPEAIRLVV
jgi:selenide,water dikinase